MCNFILFLITIMITRKKITSKDLEFAIDFSFDIFYFLLYESVYEVSLLVNCKYRIEKSSIKDDFDEESHIE